MRTLFTSACVVLTMEQRHMTIRAINAPIDSVSVDRVLEITETLLGEKRPFSTTWDVRDCQIPSTQLTWTCIRWALAHKSALDEYNTNLVIKCPSSRLLGVVKLVLRVFGPKCPTAIEAST